MGSYYDNQHLSFDSLFDSYQVFLDNNSPKTSLLSLTQSLSNYLEAVQLNSYGFHKKAISLLLPASETIIKDKQRKSCYLLTKMFIEISKAKLGLGDYVGAKEYLQRASSEFSQHQTILSERNHFSGEIELYTGSINMEKHLFIEALDNFHKALAIFEGLQHEKSVLLASCHRKIGEVFLEQKKYKEAFECFEKALAAIKKREEDLNDEEYLEVVRILNRKGVFYASLQRYRESLDTLQSCLEVLRARFGIDHEELIWTYHHLGAIHIRLCLYKEAKEMLDSALNLEKKLYGDKHPWIAKTYAEKGRLLIDQERLEEGEVFLNKGIELAVDIYGEEDPIIGVYYLKLGYYYLEQERCEEAEGVFQKVLKIYQKAYGEENGLTAVGYHTLAVTFQEMGRDKEAKENYKRDLEICQKYYGENHSEVSKSYYWLGIFFWMKGNHEEAVKHLRKCGDIDQKYYGGASPQLAIDYQELARVLLDQGKEEEAMEYYRKCSEIETGYFGEKHPRVARSLFLSGVGLCDAGKWEKSKEMLERSLSVLDQDDKEGEFQIRRVYHAMGNMFNNQGKYKQALKYYGMALKVGENCGRSEELLRNVADVLYNQDKFEKALEIYSKALGLTIKNRGPRHNSVGVLYTNIGNCLGWMKDHETDALTNLKKGIEILGQVTWKEHKEKAVLLDNFYSRADVIKRTKGPREGLEEMKKAIILCRMSEKDKVKDIDNGARELQMKKAMLSKNLSSESI